jgi:GPH family glycoside/pentoside/hexuronide:cation symporter
METGVKKTSKLRYAAGMFGTSIPVNMFKTYAAIFYVDKLGLSTAQLSLVLFIYTFIDAIDNPVYGYFSDRTRTKWGRRRPWLVIGTPLLILCFIAFYNVPKFLAGNSLFVYFLLFYILTGTLDSLINTNYGALFPDLFPDEGTRAVTNALRQAFQLVAMIISIALTPVVAGLIGYAMTSVVYGILGGGVILYMTFGCHENPERALEEKPVLLGSLKSLALNRKFWIAGFANAFYGAAMSLVMVSLPFFAKYTLKIPDNQTTILFATVLIIAMGGVAVWARLIEKFTLIPVWRAALIILCAAFIPLYFSSNLITAAVSSCFVGFGFAGVIATMDLIGAKIMDEDTEKSGLRREGIISSTMGFMNRLNGLFTSLAFYLVFVFFGFKSGQNPGANPEGAARFLLTLFPFTVMLISCIFSMFLNFKKKEEKVCLKESL